MNAVLLVGKILAEPKPHVDKTTTGTLKASFFLALPVKDGELVIEALAFGKQVEQLPGPGSHVMVAARLESKENRFQHKARVVPDVILLCTRVELLLVA